MEVTYRRRLRRLMSHGDEYFLVAIPPVLARSMDCEKVDIIVCDESVCLLPVRDEGKCLKQASEPLL
jgi:hypothetical protein